MNIHLKVKVSSLAAEARIIRNLEKKFKRGDHPVRVSLSDHRRGVVRYEARHSHLAYGFLRNRSYATMEAKARVKPDWNKVAKMVERYGDGDKRELMQRFEAWRVAEPA
jgi:hypothetical protein